MTKTITLLSTVEQTALVRCEAEIEEGKAIFMKVGNALARIRDERLYRVTHGTFEKYCQDRWGFSRQYAAALCRATEVVKNLGLETNCLPEPATEGATRPLTKLPKEQQAEAWQAAVESSPTGKPTAREVEKIVQERISTTVPTQKFTCSNCGGHELSEHDDCESCKEPAEVKHRKPKKPRFDQSAAIEKLFDTLEQLKSEWPVELHHEFYAAVDAFSKPEVV